MFSLPIPGKMSRQQIFRYRCLLALQLRAGQMDYSGIANVLKATPKQAQAMTVKGFRFFRDCILDTIKL